MIHDPASPAAFSGEKKGVLEFDHVSFRYPGADEDVLDEAYLRFDFGGNQPHMVDGKWTTEQYVKVK